MAHRIRVQSAGNEYACRQCPSEVDIDRRKDIPRWKEQCRNAARGQLLGRLLW